MISDFDKPRHKFAHLRREAELHDSSVDCRIFRQCELTVRMLTVYMYSRAPGPQIMLEYHEFAERVEARVVSVHVSSDSAPHCTLAVRHIKRAR